MKFTEEQIKKAKSAKSAEELLALAKENGIALTEEEAAKYFADLHREGELSDDELDNVSGGLRLRNLLCPNCQTWGNYVDSDQPRECKTCGYQWN